MREEEEAEEREEEEEEEEDGGNGSPLKKKFCPKQQWDKMNESLESKIEAAFPFQNWSVAKNLMRKILKCPQVCISSDFRLAYTKNQEFSIIVLLQLATCQAGPNEDFSSSGRPKNDRCILSPALFPSWPFCWQTRCPSPT